jgi:hypothetical protein
MLRESGRILSPVAILLSLAIRADAIEPPILMKEAAGRDAAPGQQGCPLEPNLTGDCANLRYYNLCSGYIWIYSSGQYHVGVLFDGPCVVPGNRLDKAITYYRNVVPGYSQTVDVYIDADLQPDGCPDYAVAEDRGLDPALRWNCTGLDGRCTPSDAAGLIVRMVQNGGTAPNFATDGPFSQDCDPVGTPHSYFYGFDGNICVPWEGPTDRNDNFLTWLIVDSGCTTTATRSTSWGEVKGLFR